MDSYYLMIYTGILYYIKSYVYMLYLYIYARMFITVSVPINYSTTTGVDLDVIIAWIKQNMSKYEITDNVYRSGIIVPKACSKLLYYKGIPIYIQYTVSSYVFIISTLNIPKWYDIVNEFVNDLTKNSNKKIVEKVIENTINFYRYDSYDWIIDRVIKCNKIQYIESSKTKYLNTICTDYEKFLSRQDWYKNMDIGFKRGYLLYGPPGTGKTSLIRNFACKYGMNIYNVQVHVGMSAGTLQAMIKKANAPNSILIFEDIDVIFPKKCDIPLSALLNIFDGMCSHDRVIFMTTNHPERLQPSFIRPGRVDFKLKIDYADNDMLYNMLSTYRPDLTKKEKYRLVDMIDTKQKNTVLSEFQQFLIFHLDNDFDTMLNSWDAFYELENSFKNEYSDLISTSSDTSVISR